MYEGKDKGLIVGYIGIKKNMNLALKRYTNYESDEFEGIEQSIKIVKDQLDVLAQMFHNFNSRDFFKGSPKQQLDCINRAVEYVQLSSELETRFMAVARRMKQAFNLCSSSEKFSEKEKDYIHFYCAVRSVLFKPFEDSRGHAGESGQLHIAETPNGIKYLVKSNPADVTNEFAVHRIAKIIGVPVLFANLARKPELHWMK